MRFLAKAPATLPQIAEALGIAASGRDPLEAWLRMGVHLSVLRRRGDLYALGSRLARTLASEDNDAAAAMLQEVVRLHLRLLDRTPQELGKGRRFTLSDQDGPLIARSSRALEPLVFDAVDEFVPTDGAPKLLEVGAGSGTYVRRAAERNPKLTAVAVELQPDVAEVARQNLSRWGLSDRAVVEAGDIRGRAPRPEFDLATLHNNIYYFPVEGRPAVLRHVAGFLREGGRLLVTTACRGGSLLTDALDLWAAATEGSAGSPTRRSSSPSSPPPGSAMPGRPAWFQASATTPSRPSAEGRSPRYGARVNPQNELPRRSRAVRTALYLAGALALAAIVAGAYVGIRIARGELRLTDDVRGARGHGEERLAEAPRAAEPPGQCQGVSRRRREARLAARLAPRPARRLRPRAAEGSAREGDPGARPPKPPAARTAPSRCRFSGAGEAPRPGPPSRSRLPRCPTCCPSRRRFERGQWVASLRFEPVPAKTPPEMPAPRFAPLPPPPLFSSASARELRAKIAFERLSMTNMEGALAEVRAAAWHARSAKAQLLALDAKGDQAALRAIDALLGGRR